MALSIEHIQFVCMHLVWLWGRSFHLFPHQFWSHTMLVIIMMKTKTTSMSHRLWILNGQNVILLIPLSFMLRWLKLKHDWTKNSSMIDFGTDVTFFSATSSNSLYLLLKSDYRLIRLKRNFLLVIIFSFFSFIYFVGDLTGWIYLFARR